jgi:hypothetical protein
MEGHKLGLREADQVLLFTLWAMYAQPDKPVYIVAPSADLYESMILDLWSQQWPMLRAGFSFCTGALADRVLRGKSFDLQVLPRNALLEMRQALANGSVVDTTLTNMPADPNANSDMWVKKASADLTDPGTGLRETAWALAESVVTDRGSFPAVFHIAAAIRQHRGSNFTADDYIRAIATLPITPKEPPDLIQSVLAPHAVEGVTFSPYDLLKALATVSMGDRVYHRIFDTDTQIERMWLTERESALRLFSELITCDSTTPLGDEIISSICRLMQPEDIQRVTQSQPGILAVIIKRKPQLATSAAIWQAAGYAQTEIFHIVMNLDLGDIALSEIVGAILVSGSRTLPEQAFSYGNRLVIPLLEWMNSSNFNAAKLSREWIRYLRRESHAVAEWLHTHAPKSSILRLSALTIPADDSSIVGLDSHIWVPLLEELAHVDECEVIPIAAFLFALGIRTCEPIAVEYLRDSFEIVHSAAAHGDLNYEYWHPIENMAPPTARWREWDKCERIRAAFLDKFIECNWPGDALLKAVRHSDTLRELFRLSRTTWARDQYLREVAKNSLESDLPANYQRVLEYYR